MSTILFTWERGGGLGHLANILPPANRLAERGHRVVAALQDVTRASRLSPHPAIQFLPTPPTSAPSHAIAQVRNFAHLLSNLGFCDEAPLKDSVSAWRNIYSEVQPDLIVFDHSPTALLAARGLAVKRALLGTGFFCPPDRYPMPDYRPLLGDATVRLKRDEDLLLQNVNGVLSAVGAEPLVRLSRLYAEVNENFLATFPELDHYGRRNNVRYWGVWPNLGGARPVWPKGSGKRIYAYLKPFPSLPNLLAALNRPGHSVIVYGAGLDEFRGRFESETVSFASESLDLAAVGRECDLAVLNGNHGTTASMLLAGRPTLQIPLYVEQAIFSLTVKQIGAGTPVFCDGSEQFLPALEALLNDPRFSAAASSFARNYAEFDPQKQIDAVVRRIEELTVA